MGKKPPPPPAAGQSAAGPEPSLRRLLRMLGGVQLWHIEEARRNGRKWPTIGYEVVSGGGGARIFDRPHEAWFYFQQLTHAPDKDTRPEPPPIDGQQPASANPRKFRRRRPRREPV